MTLADPISESRLELSSFVGGRLPELESLLHVAHLLTLVGPPGVGKSRLARRLATQWVDARGGRLEIFDFDMPTLDVDEVLDRARAHADEPLVVVLDNCDREQAACRRLVSAVLERDPSVKLIATGRERLGLTVEQVWNLQPLGVPSADDLETVSRSPAAQLFVQRAHEIDASFTLTEANAPEIARMCRALDGLPLAIELAAARLCLLSVRSLAEHLDTAIRLYADDANIRRRMEGMAASIEWTMARLGPRQRAFLWSLSVFESSWDLASASEVCVEPSAAHEAAQMVAELVACSMVRKVEDQHSPRVRYALLSVVQRYAARQLLLSGRADHVRRRHAEWCLRTAEALAIGSGLLESLEQLKLERPNLLAALGWAVSASDAEMSFSLSNVLHGVWYIRGDFTESRAWFRKVLALPGGSRFARGLVMSWAAAHAVEQCDFTEASALSERVRAEAAALDSPVLNALGLDALAMILLAQGNVNRAEAILLEELDGCLQPETLWLRCALLFRLARVRLEQGQLESAQRFAEQALERLVADDNAWMRVSVWHVLGSIALEQHDFSSAREYLSSALDLARQLEDTRGSIDAWLDISRLEASLGNGRDARAAIDEALDLTERTTAVLPFIHVLEAVVRLRAAARPEAALHLAGTVSALRLLHNTGRAPAEDGRYTAALETARTQLRPTTGRAALRSGQTLDRRAVTALARELLHVDMPPPQDAHQSRPLLTAREMQIARLLASGLTNRAISTELFISEGTVRAHVEHILSKLNLRSRVEVGARLAAEHALPTLPAGATSP